MTIITDSRGRYIDFANEAYDRKRDIPDINTVEPRMADFDVFVDDSEIVQDASGNFVYKGPTNQGQRPRTPKAGFTISEPREWMPSALLGRPSQAKARLLLRILAKYGHSPKRLEWILLRQCVDDIYGRLSIADRDIFLEKIKRVQERIMRFEATITNMTVPLFVYRLERDQKGIFNGAGKLEPSTCNDFEYDASFWAIVGQTGNNLHFSIFGISVHQIRSQAILVDWEQMQGNGRWAESMEQWLNYRFRVDAIPIVMKQGQAVGFTEKELEERRTVNAWLVEGRNGKTQVQFCRERGIDRKTLKRYIEEHGR